MDGELKKLPASVRQAARKVGRVVLMPGCFRQDSGLFYLLI